MIFRIVVYILLLLVVLAFIGFNWDKTTDISFWFGDNAQIKNVPVCISVFCGFILGALSVIPFMIKQYKRLKSKKKAGFREVPDELEESTET